ncbi:MAG: hypothetical protein JNL42_20975 [Anaerolineae bacterium]|nr:hypothetical protein [Anaerolineae bacterium]
MELNNKTFGGIMQRIIASITITLMLVLSACGTPPPATQPPTAPAVENAQPTHTPVPHTPEPSLTAVIRATLPPEWTLTPSATPPESPTPQPQGTPVPTFDMVNAVLLTSPTREACAAFGIQYDQTALTFNRRENARVAWTAVSNAAAYRVSLYDEARSTIFATIVGETTTDFGNALFVGQARYFWEVRPFDGAGVQLCAAIGGMLIPIN